MRIVDSDEKELIVYSDPDQLQNLLLSIGPQDEREIARLCDAICRFANFDMSAMQSKPKEQMSLDDWGAFGSQMLPFGIPLLRCGQLSAEEFGQRFKIGF